MSLSGKARRAELSVTINGHDATGFLQPSLLEFTCTGYASGKADEVELVLQDREGLWNNAWRPELGMRMAASLLLTDWPEELTPVAVDFGGFSIDELEFSGPPDKVRIKGACSTLTKSLREEYNTRGWENYSLKRVALQLAAEHGLELLYQGAECAFARRDQRNESDIAFLHRLAEEWSMYCRVHDDKIVLTDKREAESAAPKIEIPRRGSPFSPTRYSNRLSSSGTDYHNVRVSYTDPAQGINHQGAAGSAGGKTLQAAVRVESQADAGRLAEARKRALNASRCMAVLECLGHPDLHPGITMRLTDFGAFSKTYFVDKATHKISASGGYTTAAEMHKAEGNTDDAGAGNSGGPDERF